MNVLVLCEFSGTVRDAFIRNGHCAMSCDLQPTTVEGPHYIGDAFGAVRMGSWDLVIAHPPCTHLAVSGARHFAKKRELGLQQEAIEFFLKITAIRVPRLAIENPVSIMSTVYRKPDQIIQPWQFGHGETKSTCLWLRGLPRLVPTCIVSGREPRVHRMPPSKDRWKLRSITYPGIAEAMAVQWGSSKPHKTTIPFFSHR